MPEYALVLNSGSSSIKFQLLDPKCHTTDLPFVSGLVEQIGEGTEGKITITIDGEKHVRTISIPDHSAGLKLAFDLMGEHGCGPKDLNIKAVGHRVVHGGKLFSEPVVLDDTVVEQVKKLIPLAPLHNPANIDGIEVAREILPEVPHIAVFDTGFFQSMPLAAAQYAINLDVAKKYDIRRYGFHGTSHEYVSQHVPELVGKPASEVNQITLHLGNGASASAIRGGVAVDTSMGLTPLAGLVMGTRCGDIDPGIVFHLCRSVGMNVDEIDRLLNRDSGLKGIAGVNDFRELWNLIEADNEEAKLAYAIYIHQLRRYIGSYMIPLGRVDAITFTAGVGENNSRVRKDALADLEMYGIKIDPERNELPNDGAREISADDSTVKVFVIPTNEELAIARYAMQLSERK